MLFIVFDQLESDPARAIVTLAVFAGSLVAAITFHEFSHALSATRLGDHTPRMLGRLSLHPRAHLDPMGTMMILFAGFGWGKPVPVNASRLITGARPGMAIVALAGPLSNIMAAIVLAIPINVSMVTPELVGFTFFRGDIGDLPGYVLSSLVFWNLLLAGFNLIPVAPLDGFKVALGLLPREAAASFARLERYGPMILMFVILSDVFIGTGILRGVLRPILNALSFVVLGRHDL